MLIHDVNHEGYTVERLYVLLGKTISKGGGNRKVMIGPTTGGDGLTEPLAVKVVGIECNSDYEEDVCWIYPDKSNVFFGG